MRDGWRRWMVRLAAVALLAALGHSFYLTLGIELKRPEGKAMRPKDVRREEELCANLVLSQLTGGSADLVHVGRVFTRRMRKGPFFIGVREMVVEDLSLCLPASYFEPPAVTNAGVAASSAGVGGTQPVMRALTTGGGRMRELLPKVANVVIRNLRIDRRDGTNDVPWLAARGASLLSEDALGLRGLSVSADGKTKTYSEGVLGYRPFISLRDLR